jgi:hypothetical protein
MKEERYSKSGISVKCRQNGDPVGLVKCEFVER